MKCSIPHPIPYQGSKRLLAELILSYIPSGINNFIEPFAGSAAVTLAAGARQIAKRYVIGDSLKPLTLLWEEIINHPDQLANDYTKIWHNQEISPRDHYLQVRNEFNRTSNPAQLLFLLARCVKNAVRFNAIGEFNQSADHRRTGMRPEKMSREIKGAHKLLSGCAQARCSDYHVLLQEATSLDFVYMDPPYQGVSGVCDPRYHEQLNFDRLLENLAILNTKQVPYILSFDGSCGSKQYGKALPDELNLTQILVHTGRSSQATLIGRNDQTTESLYLSPGITSRENSVSIAKRSEQSLRLDLC